MLSCAIAAASCTKRLACAVAWLPNLLCWQCSDRQQCPLAEQHALLLVQEAGKYQLLSNICLCHALKV